MHVCPPVTGTFEKLLNCCCCASATGTAVATGTVAATVAGKSTGCATDTPCAGKLGNGLRAGNPAGAAVAIDDGSVGNVAPTVGPASGPWRSSKPAGYNRLTERHIVDSCAYTILVRHGQGLLLKIVWIRLRIVWKIESFCSDR